MTAKDRVKVKKFDSPERLFGVCEHVQPTQQLIWGQSQKEEDKWGENGRNSLSDKNVSSNWSQYNKKCLLFWEDQAHSSYCCCMLHNYAWITTMIKSSSLSAPTKIEELTAISDEKTQRSPAWLSVLLSLSELKETRIWLGMIPTRANLRHNNDVSGIQQQKE